MNADATRYQVRADGSEPRPLHTSRRAALEEGRRLAKVMHRTVRVTNLSTGDEIARYHP